MRIAISKGAKNQDAYELLLDGIYHSEKITPADTLLSIEKLNRCIELDSDNARARVGLFECHLMNYLERWVNNLDEELKLAGDHIEKALLANPDNGPVLAAYGEHLVFSREPDKALTYIDKALKHNPNDIDAVTNKAFTLAMLGNYTEALEHAKLAFALDPYHPWVSWNVTESHILLEQYQPALESIANANNKPTL